MQAIAVFVSAASGHRFLAEFLDVGGLEMVLGMLSDTKLSETDRMRSLQVLASISNSGYTFRQLILDERHHVLDSVCSYMESATTEAAQELSRSVLIGLGRGNKRLMHLQARLVAALDSPSPLVQRTAAQVLRQLVAPGMGAPPPPGAAGAPGAPAADGRDQLVEAVGRMFAGTHVHVLYEALELAQTALEKPATRARMAEAVAEMLRPGSYAPAGAGAGARAETAAHLDVAARPEQYARSGAEEPLERVLAAGADRGATDAGRRQAAAARLVAALVRAREVPRVAARAEVLRELVGRGAVLGLLLAAANIEHSESAKHGIDALAVLARASPEAAAELERLVGPTWAQTFGADPVGAGLALDRAALLRLLAAAGCDGLLRPHERPLTPPSLAALESAAAGHGTGEEDAGGGGQGLRGSEAAEGGGESQGAMVS